MGKYPDWVIAILGYIEIAIVGNYLNKEIRGLYGEFSGRNSYSPGPFCVFFSFFFSKKVNELFVSLSS